MKTLSYIRGCEAEIEVGEEYYFGQLWDGDDGDGEERLESGAIFIWDEQSEEEVGVQFEITEADDEDPMEALVKVTSIGII